MYNFHDTSALKRKGLYGKTGQLVCNDFLLVGMVRCRESLLPGVMKRSIDESHWPKASNMERLTKLCTIQTRKK